jgi:hypothetical protein
MTVDIVPLHLGAKSVRTRLAAVAANKRLRARALEAYVCPIPTAILEDPAEPLTLDAAVLGAIAKAAWALGAHKDTIAEMRRTGVVPIGVQRLVRNPGLRPRSAAGRAQLDRAARRMRVMQAQRKRRAAARAKEKAEHGATSRSRAVNAFLRSVGTTEDPPGSNGGGIITVMENYWGFGRVPWCGISAGYHAAKYGNCDLRSDVASVAAITAHARAGHSPYGSFQTGVRGALQGAFVIIGGPNVHVGMLVEARSDGSAVTVEGNTSFGPGGSQSNGGCIARRVRSPGEIHGVATMNYPS